MRHDCFTYRLRSANLVIRTSVEPDAENRTMEVIADSVAFYWSSRITLEGDRGPKSEPGTPTY